MSDWARRYEFETKVKWYLVRVEWKGIRNRGSIFGVGVGGGGNLMIITLGEEAT